MDISSSGYLHCRGIVEYSTNTDADKRLAERNEWAAKLLTTECIWSYNEYSPVCWMILSITNSTFFLNIDMCIQLTQSCPQYVLNNACMFQWRSASNWHQLFILLYLWCFYDTFWEEVANNWCIEKQNQKKKANTILLYAIFFYFYWTFWMLMCLIEMHSFCYGLFVFQSWPWYCTLVFVFIAFWFYNLLKMSALAGIAIEAICIRHIVTRRCISHIFFFVLMQLEMQKIKDIWPFTEVKTVL